MSVIRLRCVFRPRLDDERVDSFRIIIWFTGLFYGNPNLFLITQQLTLLLSPPKKSGDDSKDLGAAKKIIVA